jgi:flagellar basal body-associated protein FliL
MKKALMIIAIVAIVAIAGSMIYYYVFFRTGIEKAEIRIQEQKLELEKNEIDKKNAEEALRKENLEKCLKELEDWKKNLFEEIQYLEEAEFAWKAYQDELSECYRKYPKTFN